MYCIKYLIEMTHALKKDLSFLISVGEHGRVCMKYSIYVHTHTHTHTHKQKLFSHMENTHTNSLSLSSVFVC